jgi:Divergent InlB B-repeat domain
LRESTGHKTERKVLLLFSLAIVLFATLTFTREAPVSASTQTDVEIIGDSTAFQTPPLDLCKAIGLAITTCDIGVTVKEEYSQLVSLSFSANQPAIQQGNNLQMSVAVSPQSPTTSFVFIFTLLGKNFTSTHTAPSTPLIGAGEADQFSIPIKTILQELGVPVPSLIPLPGSLRISLQARIQLDGTTKSTGFTDGVPLNWTSASAFAEPVTLVNALDTSTFGISTLTSVQKWSVAFDVTGMPWPLPSTTNLYALPLAKTQFAATSNAAINYYRVTIEPAPLASISPEPSTQWYVEGYKMELHSVPVSGYHLVSWISNGNTMSTNTALSVTVNSPLDLQSTYDITPFNAPSPMVVPAEAIPLLILVTALVAVSFTVMLKRRNNP